MKLAELRLKLLEIIEDWSSMSDIDWEGRDLSSITLIMAGIEPDNSLKQKLFNLRSEYLSAAAGDKTISLKNNTTLESLLDYVSNDELSETKKKVFESIQNELHKLREVHLGDDAGDKKIKLKNNTTAATLFEYVIKQDF